MGDVYAAGAICATAEDLVRWRRGHESGRVLSRRAYASVNDSSTIRGLGAAYGFGGFLGALGDRPWIAHNGSINGFSTRLASYPRDSLTVVVLASTGGANVAPMERATTRTIRGLPDPAPRSLAVSAADAARYVSTYADRAHGGQ
jgi:D-alanyl-D-alanine carboxypeptidase